MHRNICSRSIAFVVATFLRVSLSTTIAIAVSSLASLGQVNSMERTTLSEEAPDQIISDQKVMPLDAFGYLGGCLKPGSINRIRPRTIRATKFGRQRLCTV